MKRQKFSSLASAFIAARGAASLNMLVLSDLQALASNYASTGVYLSGESLALLLSLNQYCEFYNWRGAALDDELTQTEKDTIQAIVDKAYAELMADNPLIGTIVFAARGSMGNGLLCDGGTYARDDYPQLYAVLDPFWIVDSDNFTVPNLINSFVAGTDEFMGETGGSETVTLTKPQMPAHTHEESGHTHIYSGAVASVGAAITGVPVPSAVPSLLDTGMAFVNLTTEGDSQPHNNMPPYVKLFPFIIWR